VIAYAYLLIIVPLGIVIWTGVIVMLLIIIKAMFGEAVGCKHDWLPIMLDGRAGEIITITYCSKCRKYGGYERAIK
jgi:hypothetical protein